MIVSRCRNLKEFKELFYKVDNKRLPKNPLEMLKHWNYHFCFYDEKDLKLIGCIYIEDDEGLICLSGFADRKRGKEVLGAVKFVSEFMRKDTIYSRTDKRAAKLVLLKSGFKKFNDNLFIRKAY